MLAHYDYHSGTSKVEVEQRGTRESYALLEARSGRALSRQLNFMRIRLDPHYPGTGLLGCHERNAPIVTPHDVHHIGWL
jgi:hypothetical protein